MRVERFSVRVERFSVRVERGSRGIRFLNEPKILALW